MADARISGHPAGASGTAGAARAPRAPRSIRLVRAAVLVAVAMAITFTATLHEQLGFDRAVAAIGLGAIGAVHIAEWLASRARLRAPVPLLLGATALAAAALLAVQSTSLAFSVVLAAWALVSGILEFIRATLGAAHRQDALLMGATGVLLALLVLLVRDDPVAAIGFLGGYAIVGGVFLGISAFDKRHEPAGPSGGGDPESSFIDSPETAR